MVFFPKKKDSVMVIFGVKTVEEAMKLGREAAALISKEFKAPVKLEFEKVYYPYLLINKKRYAGVFWTKPEKYDKVDTKGLENVRRDNCAFVRELMNESLEIILLEMDENKAIENLKKRIESLLSGEEDPSKLVITKCISREMDQYKGKQAHIELVKKMQERDFATAPKVGDRVKYMIIKAPKGSKAFEKSEDPRYIIENDIQVDYESYLKSQAMKPLLRIFKPILFDKTKSLFSGAHTIKRVDNFNLNNISDEKKTGILACLVEVKTCLICKSKMDKKIKGFLCSKCKPKREHLKIEYEEKFAEKISQRFDLMKRCFKCSGECITEKTCVAQDCEIFYTRFSIRKGVQKIEETLKKINESW